jgi:hypothetical protein
MRRWCAGAVGALVERASARPPATTLYQTIVSTLSGFGVWLSQAIELLGF